MPRKRTKRKKHQTPLEPWMIEFLKNGYVDESNYTKKEVEQFEWEVIDWEFGPFLSSQPMLRPHEAWAILKQKANPRDYPYAYKKFEKGESKTGRCSRNQ